MLPPLSSHSDALSTVIQPSPAQLLLPIDRYERIRIGGRVLYLPLASASAAPSSD